MSATLKLTKTDKEQLEELRITAEDVIYLLSNEAETIYGQKIPRRNAYLLCQIQDELSPEFAELVSVFYSRMAQYEYEAGITAPE